MDDCPICCERYTDVLRKAIKCPYCNVKTCTRCVKTFLLTSTSDPSCMSCKVGWQNEFIDTVFSNNFRTGDLRKHRENVLLDREKSMLPATVPYVEQERQKREGLQLMKDLMDRKKLLKQEIREIDEEIDEISVAIKTKTKIDDKREFVRACPAEGCRGFLSTQWVCGVCDTKVCCKCHEIKNDNHECRNENLETAMLLNKDSKPCVNCGALIFKVSGCNQIFCTQCHTAFDWNTGKIEKNNIHNPHYYEWLRTQNNGEIPRAAGDVRCGGLPGYWQLDTILKINKIKFNYSEYLRLTLHIMHVELPRYQVQETEDKNRDLRIMYLMNEISEETWKKTLHSRERKLIKKAAIFQVLDMYVNSATDLLQRVLEAKNQVDADKITKEFEELRAYYNKSMLDVLTRIGYSVKKQINSSWNFVDY